MGLSTGSAHFRFISIAKQIKLEQFVYVNFDNLIVAFELTAMKKAVYVFYLWPMQHTDTSSCWRANFASYLVPRCEDFDNC